MRSSRAQEWPHLQCSTASAGAQSQATCCSVSCAMSGTTSPACTCSRGSRALWRRTPDLCATCVCAPGGRGLDSLVSLLISLKKVPVVITERLVLQCLVERAIAWQRRTRGYIMGGVDRAKCSRDGRSSTFIQV